MAIVLFLNHVDDIADRSFFIPDQIMMLVKAFSTLLLIGLISCGQKPAKLRTNAASVELNNKAMALVPHIDNADSSRKAILLLDQATAMDSTYFLGHFNKLMFYNQLRQFDKSVFTVNKLLRLRPSSHDLYLTGGFLYELLGKSDSSTSYFERSLAICNKVLDTMKKENRDYEMLVGNKVVNLIMLGDSVKAHELIRSHFNHQSDSAQRAFMLSLINKSKEELIEFWTWE